MTSQVLRIASVRFLLNLGGNCFALVPVMVPSRNTDANNNIDGDNAPTFRTEFAALLETVGGPQSDSSGGIQSIEGATDVEWSERRTHMARSQRIYVGGKLAIATSAFLTAGGMNYY